MKVEFMHTRDRTIVKWGNGQLERKLGENFRLGSGCELRYGLVCNTKRDQANNFPETDNIKISLNIFKNHEGNSQERKLPQGKKELNRRGKITNKYVWGIGKECRQTEGVISLRQVILL
jgi:hypothetical protein